ncbi:MAG: EscR/YscR/HrcR family type III secretion system export apparatus protein [Deltaproteobacteria bacterium CG11_big_fil_rev_8_21_14_0_20_49_13]|nr:MAG: EscR/YscR/HrcR family type III secretion system export apparatus protein [Deltaproteobacteria bacterium CG11_big_fil_rev_8_21_14_0_20_49_13]
MKRSHKRKFLAIALLSAAAGVLMSLPAMAAEGRAMQSMGVSRPLVMLVVLAGLSMVPFVVMMSTSFVKIAVVLSLVRNAMGTQQVPPNIVVTGLSLILTIYVMMPVGYEVYRAAGSVINQGTNQPLLSQTSVALLVDAGEKGKEPVRNFLLKHVHPQERSLFYNLALKLVKNEDDRAKITDEDFVNLIPAFCISELTRAFQIGFVIFLPFLIIDVVIANILLSLGMFQISPITLSLPFKLLLFVLVDGWHLITKGLIMGYV